MKTSMIKLSVLALSVVSMMSLTAPAFAADAAAHAALTFGVIDMNKVLRDTDAAKDVFSQLEGKRKEYQTQISKEEDTLRAADQAIMKEKEKLSKEEFEKKRKEFEMKVVDAQKLVQERKSTLDRAFNSSMIQVRNAAAKIVAAVAKEKGYSTVFTNDAVMMSADELDMTTVVIERMNKDVKKMKVDWSAPVAAEKKK
jgi:Skp family chaperone for outer membrane proteins